MHAALAIAGVALWVGVVANGEADDAGLAWIALLLFLLAASGGLVMFRRWRRGGDDRQPRAEAEIPSSLAYLHGLAAAGTIVLVALAAAGVGD